MDAISLARGLADAMLYHVPVLAEIDWFARYADDLNFSGGPDLLRRVDRLIALVGAIAIAIAMADGLRVNSRRCGDRGKPVRCCCHSPSHGCVLSVRTAA